VSSSAVRCGPDDDLGGLSCRLDDSDGDGHCLDDSRDETVAPPPATRRRRRRRRKRRRREEEEAEEEEAEEEEG